MKILVTGASGFIGRNLCRALLKADHNPVGLARTLPSDNNRIEGVVYATGDVRTGLSPAEQEAAFTDCDAVVHLVGIIAEVRGKGQTFEAIHVGGTTNIVNAATTAGVRRFIYISALGASPASRSEYARTKAQAEAIVTKSDTTWTIFRPSVVAGPKAEFIQQIEALIRRPPLCPIPLPFIPVPGKGTNKMQPLWIDDLTTAIIASLQREEARQATIEIGGRDAITLDALLEGLATNLGIQKPILHLPFAMMFPAAAVLEAILPKPPITVDQLIQLQTDNVCDNAALTETLGITPIGYEEILWRLSSAR